MRELGTRTAFPDGGRGNRRGPRRPHARGAAPRAAELLPVRALLRLGLPWPRHLCESLGDDWAKPENLVGNGPFVLVEYGEEHALLQANPHWTGARGNVGEIHFSFYPKDSRMVEEWKRGRFDLLHVYDLGPEDDPLTLSDLVPELGVAVPRLLRRPAAVLEPARSQGLLPRSRPRVPR